MGAGYVTSQQMFDPDVLPPHAINTTISTAATDQVIRPILNSTFKVGGYRRKNNKSRRMHKGNKTRRYRGGFSPSVMGSFIQNAQQAIVPLALYSAYHLMPKKGRNIFSARRKSVRRK
jgi:hypothetical protein